MDSTIREWIDNAIRKWIECRIFYSCVYRDRFERLLVRLSGQLSRLPVDLIRIDLLDGADGVEVREASGEDADARLHQR
jgi:hypothetical protein